MEGLAEYYSAELSQKIRRGLHENRVKGYYSGGIIPYGYYVEKKKVYIKEDEATIVRQIFQYYAQGITVKEILQNLAEKGITYKGRPFAMNTVYQMLRLEKYIGICRYDEGVYDNIFPAIVPKQLFDDVKAILAKNKIGSRSGQTDFLLKGNVICANGQHKILKAAELNVDQSRNPISDYGFPINLFFIINFTINICFYLQ